MLEIFQKGEEGGGAVRASAVHLKSEVRERRELECVSEVGVQVVKIVQK